MFVFLIILMISIIALTAMISHERGYNKELDKAISNVNAYIKKIDNNTLTQHDIDSFETICKIP